MAKIGIFFGSDTGNTRKAAKLIAEKLGDLADKPVSVSKASVDDVLAYEYIILGSPTYGEGELPGQSSGMSNDCWEEFLPQLQGADFGGKQVAIFGLGDAAGYPTHFVDAMGLIYDVVLDGGATVVGFTSTDGYDFTQSKAVEDDQFVGLALDDDNQKELTAERISAWTAQLLSVWGD